MFYYNFSSNQEHIMANTIRAMSNNNYEQLVVN